MDFSAGLFEKLIHESPLKTFSEGHYSIPVRCVIDETLAEREAKIELT